MKKEIKKSQETKAEGLTTTAQVEKVIAEFNENVIDPNCGYKIKNLVELAHEINLHNRCVPDMSADEKAVCEMLYNKGKLAGKHKCSITGQTYYGYGNNAWPFSGRCSNKANERYVIPFRVAGVTPDLIKAFGGNKQVRKSYDLFLKKRA